MSKRIGVLAKEHCNLRLPLQVLRSAAGFYIGTANDSGPVSRESEEYFATRESADSALENDDWTQKGNP